VSTLYFKNAIIATEEEVFPGGLVIEGEQVVSLVKGNVDVKADLVEDLNGRFLLPGLVDDHAHFNEPGRTHWEGYLTGSMAAAAGGITTVLEMPLNSTPPTINRAQLLRKRQVVKDQAVIDYAQWGGLVNNNLEDLADLHEDGVVGYKAFMSNSGVDFERIDDDLLYAGLQFSGQVGNVIGLHAENEYVTRFLGEKMRAAGRTDRASWYESRPPESELEAIRRACYWAEVAKGNLHIVHISIAEGMRAVAEAKKRGVRVTAETCPHYLTLDQDDFVRLGPVAKCAPPLRSRQEVDALWECVLAGMVDTIASDHSPCTWEEKAPGLTNIWKGWGGISGIQTMLPVLITEGVHKRGLPLTALARMTSSNPARIFGLYPQKGSLMPGADADFVVVDLNKEWTLAAEDLFYKNKHSPYIGFTFRGKVEQTYVRGKPVYKDGMIVVEPGYGKALRRSAQ